MDSANLYIREARYEKHVACNERIMLNVLLDYYADIFRLKEFHDIQYVRTEKIFAYIAAWIVKRKPLQFIHDTDEEKDVFVNERFAVFLLLNSHAILGERYTVNRYRVSYAERRTKIMNAKTAGYGKIKDYKNRLFDTLVFCET